MPDTREVLIDGVRYVPAVDLVRDTLADKVMQALYEQFMGAGTAWRDDPYMADLRIVVTDDADDGGDTFAEFAARIAEL